MERLDVCKSVKAKVGAAFSKCIVTTNDDMNPATPVAVTVEWPDNLRRTVRAQSLTVDADTFAAAAIGELSAFYKKRRGGSVPPQN
jgi:hypothetical protein